MISKAKHIQRAIGRISAAFPEGEEDIEVALTELRRAAKRAKLTATGKDDWGTPREIIDAINAVAPITLDCAASPTNAVCANYYTADGEKLSWATDGIAWCNPPFSRGNKLKFARKFAEERGLDTACALLLGGDESNAAARIAYDAASYYVWFDRRLKYEGATGAAPFQTRVYFSREAVRLGAPNKLAKLPGATLAKGGAI